MNPRRKKRLVDRLLDAYISWREASLRVSDAYASWTSETGIRASVAFGAYMAALDREEDAAEAYAVMVRRTRELALGEPDPSVASDGPTSRAAHR